MTSHSKSDDRFQVNGLIIPNCESTNMLFISHIVLEIKSTDHAGLLSSLCCLTMHLRQFSMQELQLVLGVQ